LHFFIIYIATSQLPGNELNPDIHKRIAFGKVSKPIFVRTTHSPHTLVFAVRIHDLLNRARFALGHWLYITILVHLCFYDKVTQRGSHTSKLETHWYKWDCSTEPPSIGNPYY